MRILPLTLLFLAACRASDASEGDVWRVVPLQHAAANEVADELNRLVAPARSAGPDVVPAYTFVADPRTNSVIVKTSAADLDHAVELIAQLDQKVEPKSK